MVTFFFHQCMIFFLSTDNRKSPNGHSGDVIQRFLNRCDTIFLDSRLVLVTYFETTKLPLILFLYATLVLFWNWRSITRNNNNSCWISSWETQRTLRNHRLVHSKVWCTSKHIQCRSSRAYCHMSTPTKNVHYQSKKTYYRFVDNCGCVKDTIEAKSLSRHDYARILIFPQLK